MSKRKYTHVQALLTEIRVMVKYGNNRREIAEHFGLKDKRVVKELLKRKCRKERNAAAGITPRAKGRPRKNAPPRDIVAEQAYEIKRLKMENELLRDGSEATGKS